MKMVDKRSGVYMYVVSEGGEMERAPAISRFRISGGGYFFRAGGDIFSTEKIRRLERAFLIAWNAISNEGMVKGVRCFVIPLHKQKRAKKKKSRSVPSAKCQETTYPTTARSRFSCALFPSSSMFLLSLFSTKTEQRTRTEDWAVQPKV